jgi:plasmid stabilization system protein ParE
VKVIWSEPAEADLDALFDYIARDSPFNAERFIGRILEAVNAIAPTPRIGQTVPEEPSTERLRQCIVQSQRVIYEIDDDTQTLAILALVHVRQDLAGQDRLPWE